MADIVPTLFGITPEMYDQSQQARIDQQALQYAKLNPFERASFGISRGANMLGGALGRNLGGEDPERRKIQLQQQILGSLDLGNPTSLIEGARQANQMGLPQLASTLVDRSKALQESIALTQQRLAAGRASDAAAGRERFEADPEKVRLARAVAATKGVEGTPEYKTAYAESLEKQMTPAEKAENKTEIQRLQEYAATLPAGSPLLAQVQAVIKAKSEPSGPKITNVLPGQPVPTKDWMDFTTKILSGDPVMQRTSTILSDAPSAIEIIRNSTSNDFAAASLPTSIALLTGQGKNMSNADVNRFARTGGLDDRLAQDAVKFFTGGTTQVKKEQAEKFAVALYRGALIERKKKLQTAAEEFGYLTSPNYKFALNNIDDQLDQFKLVKKGETPSSTQKTGNPLVDKWLSTDAEKK